MNAKSFLFVAAWMKPLKTLPAEQRWNVMEAIAEYATTGQMTKELELMETIAFAFIRNEIDRMQAHRAELSESRRDSATKRWKKAQQPTNQPEIPAKNAANATNDANNANDANVCNEIQEDAPFISESVSESVSESKSESKKSSSTSSYVRARGRECRQRLFLSSSRQKKSDNCFHKQLPLSAFHNTFY